MILCYFLRHVSQELHYLLYFMFYGSLQCLCLCVCLCVCFMSMGFMPEINSCYAMLDIVVTISDRTNGRMNERTNVPSGQRKTLSVGEGIIK